jgi:predicted PurR-regulated permease PerM
VIGVVVVLVVLLMVAVGFLAMVCRTQGSQLNELVTAHHEMENHLRDLIRHQRDANEVVSRELRARIGETKAMLESTRMTQARHHSDIHQMASELEAVMVFLADIPQNFAFNKTPATAYQMVLPDRLKLEYSRER